MAPFSKPWIENRLPTCTKLDPSLSTPGFIDSEILVKAPRTFTSVPKSVSAQLMAGSAYRIGNAANSTEFLVYRGE